MTDARGSRPWRDPHAAYEGVLRSTSYGSIVRSHARYYTQWQPAYLKWVRYQYGLTLSGEWPRMAMVRALQQQILYEDPVVYDWPHIQARALVIGGQEDRTSARYAELARGVAEALQNAELVLFPGVGHNPHFEIPERFHAELIRFLTETPEAPDSRR
jgi:pimeloyl-ACP methyl ester carboxylesterase